MNIRLKEARKKAGFKTASQAIAQFGWRSSTYHAHENGQNRFGVDDAERYARAYGVSVEWLLAEKGEAAITAEDTSRREHITDKRVSKCGTSGLAPLTGFVARGLFREVDAPDMLPKESFRRLPADPRFDIAAQFDLIVQDEKIPDFAFRGDFLRCLKIADIQDELAPGDWIILERTAEPNLIEMTARKVISLSAQEAEVGVPGERVENLKVPLTKSGKAGRLQQEIIAKVLYVIRPV